MHCSSAADPKLDEEVNQCWPHLMRPKLLVKSRRSAVKLGSRRREGRPLRAFYCDLLGRKGGWNRRRQDNFNYAVVKCCTKKSKLYAIALRLFAASLPATLIQYWQANCKFDSWRRDSNAVLVFSLAKNYAASKEKEGRNILRARECAKIWTDGNTSWVVSALIRAQICGAIRLPSTVFPVVREENDYAKNANNKQSIFQY